MLAAGCKEEGTIKVHRLAFKGVKAVDESRLKDALATRQSSRIPWGRKYFFDRTRFDADLKRIQAFYADRGYPDARVSGFDVNLNDKQDAVDLTVTIAEGEPVKVAAIDFVGFDVIPPDHLAKMKSDAPLKVGAPRDRQLVVAAHELALNELKDHGFPYAKVSTTEDDGTDGKTATLTFTAEPGKVAHFGPVEIQGNRSVSDHVIERELTFKPGDLYRRSIVQDSQRRLYGMELFQFVNVEPLNPELQPTDVPMKVTVAEGNHQRVNFGVGYGTEEKARTDVEYHHVNFLGGARSAGVHARYSSLDRGVRVDFNQPYFFRPHFALSGEGQDWYTFTPAYQSVVAGAKATLTHKTSEKSSWSVSMISEHDRSTVTPGVLANPAQRNSLIALGLDPVTGVQNGTLNALAFDMQRSTADNVLNAHRGYQIAFHAEQAGRVVPGSFAYDAVSADGRQYLPLGSDRLILASRLQLGNIQPASADPTKVPFGKKYFLGGATSVRGWGRYELSPLSAGLPIGGNSMLALSEEIRAVISGNFGGVIFLDGGNVWADSWGIRFGELRYAVGPGLRYQTPIGPIRFDIGYQLNPIDGLLVNGSPQTRRWRMHFSIGQAY
ncbi:MAG TPA: BamA/TamA family outer membrane protein [Vicinamibacterales bacterium]|nr:BamA/TamA family outer membrane protein [Vicinamibacterales bacterium]